MKKKKLGYAFEVKKATQGLIRFLISRTIYKTKKIIKAHRRRHSYTGVKIKLW